jgi:Fe-S cluster biogenesis protein NfuA
MNHIPALGIPQHPLLLRVEHALESIRPFLIADGGNVEILEITPENIVRVKLVGACSTCPMSSMTLKAGVEDAILKAVPEIIGIEALLDDQD